MVKKIKLFFIVFVLLFSFCACDIESNNPTPQETPLSTEEPPKLKINTESLDDELKIAYTDGYGQPYLYAELDEEITEDEFLELLNQAVQISTGDGEYTWSAAQTESEKDPLLRKDAAKLLYDVTTKELGISERNAEPRHYIDDYYFMEDIDPEFDVGEYSNYMIFVSSMACLTNGRRLMECDSDGYFRINDAMTVREALQAVYRLNHLSNLYLTDIQKKEAYYVSMDEASYHDSSIITEALINKTSALPEASNAHLPYWNGYNLENKLSAGSYRYITEDEIKFLADNGYNAARILYSMSLLTDPEQYGQINLSELEQLDEIISWGLKYDVHIMISMIGIPNQKTSDGYCDWDTENIGGKGGALLLEDPMLLALTKDIYTMLANRYKDILNKNLSFELFAEPTFPDTDEATAMDNYYTVAEPIVQSIWGVSPDRIIIVNDISKWIPEKLMQLGCAVSVHDHIYTYELDDFFDDIGVEVQHEVPIYLPSHIDNSFGEEYGNILISHETQFDAGIFQMNLLLGNINVYMDDTLAYEESTNNEQYHWIAVDIPSGTKSIRISTNNYLQYSAIVIDQNNGDYTSLGISDLLCGIWCAPWGSTQKAAQITIGAGGHAENTEGTTSINADYLWDTMYKPFADAAQKYGVGFAVTEISNRMYTRTKEQELEFCSMYLDTLKTHGVSWFFCALQDAFGQITTPGADWMMEIYRKDGRNISLVHGIHNDFTEYTDLIDLMKSYME